MGQIRENVKRNLGYYLSLRGISQKELSEKLHVSQAAVTNWIKGKNSPDIELVANICEILEISVIDLFGTPTVPIDITDHEKELILKYRESPNMQAAVDRILGINK